MAAHSFFSVFVACGQQSCHKLIPYLDTAALDASCQWSRCSWRLTLLMRAKALKLSCQQTESVAHSQPELRCFCIITQQLRLELAVIPGIMLDELLHLCKC